MNQTTCHPSVQPMRIIYMTNKDTLFYDGACPLCSAEMDRLRSLSGPMLELVDVHTAASATLPATKEATLKVLHLMRENGEILTGVEANVFAWQHTRWGFLFRWMRWPVIRVVADFVYTKWAHRRYQRLYSESTHER
ncbi:MAG: putative DCC family thiol-disulfide oxidoreductase YuxK [Candidatus Azotimanducaceae bacterium]|jgi:predicted DCC family thiol-disulfide oxidoreductase YuxK